MPDKTEQEIAAIGATGCAVAWQDCIHDAIDNWADRRNDGMINLAPVLSGLLNGLAEANATRLHDHRIATIAAHCLLERARAHDVQAPANIEQQARDAIASAADQ